MQILSITVKDLQTRIDSKLPLKTSKISLQAVLNGVNESIGAAPPVAEIHLRPQPGRQSTSASIKTKFEELIVETTGVSPSDIMPSMSLEELGVDSLALIEILSTLADGATDYFGDGQFLSSI